MSEQEHVRVERVSPDLWRVYSPFDGEFIDMERHDMKALLDLMLMRAAEFHEPPIIFNAEEPVKKPPRLW